MDGENSMVNLISVMDLVGFVSSLVSLILAIFAIWLSKVQKEEADKINQETRNLLIDIKTDANTISSVAMPELKAYGDVMRKAVIGNVNSPVKSIPEAPNTDITIPPNETIETINQDRIIMDLTELGLGYKEIAINKNHKFKYLVEMLFHELLSNKVESNSYGRDWLIINSDTNQKIGCESPTDLEKTTSSLIDKNSVYKLKIN
jgi:hypothetical protein